MLDGTLKFEAVQIEELPPFFQSRRVFSDVFPFDASPTRDPRRGTARSFFAAQHFLAAAQTLAESEERANDFTVRPNLTSHNLQQIKIKFIMNYRTVLHIYVYTAVYFGINYDT